MNNQEQIVFHDTDRNGQRWRVVVVIHQQEIARVLGAKAIGNRTHKSRLAGFAYARATKE